MRLPTRTFRLQTLLAAWCSAAVLVVVLLLASVAMRLLEADLRANAESDQAALVEATAHDIDEKIDERRGIIAAAAKALPAEQVSDVQALQVHFNARPVLRSFFDAILVLDDKGRIVFRTPADERGIGRSLGDRAYVQHVLATGETVVSEPVAARTTHEPTIVFASALRNATGQVRGVLIGGIVLTKPNFLGSLATRRIGRNGYFYLATKGERPVLAVHPKRERIMEPVPDAKLNPHLNRALAGFEGTVEGMNSRGLQALYTYRSLTSVPWVLAGAYPSAEAFGPMAKRRAELTTAAFLVAALAGSVIVLLCTGLMRPMRELRRRIVEVTHGRGEGFVEAPGRASDVADIVHAYNALIRHKGEAERALHARERQLRAVTDNLPALIAYVDRDRIFRFVNATHEAWFGKPVSEIVDQPMESLLGPQVAAERMQLIDRVMNGERVEFEHVYAPPHNARHVQGVYIPDRAEDGSVRGCHVLILDVTEAKTNERRLAELARKDPLTGLPNRRDFEERLDAAMARARRSGRAIALMVLDVDHFKRINDTLGHAAGDEVLKAFAQRLLASVRSTDTVSRLAGDEFTVILEGLGLPDEARIVASKIIGAMAPAVELPSGGTVQLSTSIGIAAYDGDGMSPAEFVNGADAALYEAKRAGRGGFHLAAEGS